jgi:hypothetical protein
MANLGANNLYMRVGLRGGDGSTIFASTAPAILPPDGVWRSVDFDLTAAGLTSVSGANTLEQVLGNVIEVRLLSAIGGPAFMGDPIAGTLGTDNIVARETVPRIFRITDLSFVGSAPRVPHLRFATINGRSHRVERKNSLADATWTPLPNATNIVGDGSGFAEVDDVEPGAANQPKRFYRVVLLPPP